MCLFKKIFRENISSVLFVIGLVVSCFVLINIGDLLGKINKENKSYNGYNNIINIDIFYPYMISNENTDNNLINDNYNDVIMGVLANTSKGNVYIDIEINVNNEVEKKEATLVFKKNEKIIMECKSECDYSIKNGIVMLNYMVCENPSELLNKDDIFSVKGFGKFRLDEVVGKTKRDRVVLKVLKYI